MYTHNLKSRGNLHKLEKERIHQRFSGEFEPCIDPFVHLRMLFCLEPLSVKVRLSILSFSPANSSFDHIYSPMRSAPNCGSGLPEPPATLKRLFRNTFWAGLVLCCAIPAGCQKNLLQNVRQTQLTMTLKEKVSKPIPQELVGLHVYLSQDLWVRNHNWTPFQEWKTLQDRTQDDLTSSMDVHRWVFGSLKENKLLAESADTETPESAPLKSAEKTAVASTEKKSPEPESKPKADPLSEKEKKQHENWSFNTLQDFFVRTGFQDSTSKTGSALPAGKIAALKQLSERNSLAGWNAAILWATLDPATALETLPLLEKVVFEDLTYDPSAPDKIPATKNREISLPGQQTKNNQAKPELIPISPSMKHAAINGICLVLSHANAIPFQTKNKLTQLLQRPDISIEQRGELYRGLARFLPPTEIPSLEQSLDVSDNTALPPKNLRWAAMDACLIHGLWFYAEQNQISHTTPNQIKPREYDSSPWPENIMQIRWDSDAVIRWNFGYWAALVRHPDAEAILTSQLRDADLLVQNKAIEHLGILGTEQALALLQEQAERPQESSRIAAVLGLMPWGAHYLAPLKDDAASSVRRTVAEGLGQTVSPEAALLLRSLINDRSSDVQLAVIETISEWPDDLAIPLLLEGIQEGVFKTRRKSVMQLIHRTGSGGSISIEGPKAERIAAVRELVRTEQLPAGLWDQLMKHGLQTSSEIDNRRVAEIQSYFQDLISQPRDSAAHRHAYEELSNISPNEIGVLEKLILETSIEIPDEIYTELLPELDPDYTALNQLTSTHISDRRKAAQLLLISSQKVSLNPIIVKRLRKLMTHEQDRLVWRIVMSAIEKDNYEETAQLALLAINHNWPDIRILGCEYLGTYGLPHYATWLMPLLADKNDSVQLAAINAIGHCHNPLAINGVFNSSPDKSPGPSLRSLLTHSSPRVRFETVVALCRLDDVEGMQEMVRLSNDKLNSTRLDAVREMGDSGKTRFVEPLIQSAWTERNNSTLKEILSSLDKLVPASEKPANLNPELNYSEQAKIWMNWWQTQHSGPASRLFTGR
tara:strand:- start:77317 stop:80454 length:3138 start_codon:yes stop_codon:yes gene_type:complete